MDVNHVIAAAAIPALQDKYAAKEWQRRAQLGAAVRRTRRSAAPRHRWLEKWRPQVVRAEGGA